MNQTLSPYVLLINPWIYDFAAFDLWAKPLGLLYIASALRRHDYEVQLIDCLHYDGHFKQTRSQSYRCHRKQKPYGTGSFYYEEIEKPPVFRDIPRRFKRYGMPVEEFRVRLSRVAANNAPFLVCVTSHMTYWYPGIFEVIRIVKSVFPFTPVCLGGIYATLCYEHARDNSGADYIIKGPGELEVLRLADILCGRSRDYCHSMTTNIELRIRRNTPLLPAYDLYLLTTNGVATPSLNSVGLLTSMGCPFRCTYCASSLLGTEFIRRGAEAVVAEIEYYVSTLEVEDIAFYDDALLVDPECHIIPILKLLIKKGLSTTRFHTPNGLHPRYIDLRLARLLREAGFRTIRLGFEGTSSRVQKASSNKVSGDELERAVRYLQVAGYSARDIGVYILVGLPGQGVKEVEEAVEFVNKTGAMVKLAEYSPIPGTKEFEMASIFYPQVVYEPLSHNKSAFPHIGMGIDYKRFNGLKSLAKRLNAELEGKWVKKWDVN